MLKVSGRILMIFSTKSLIWTAAAAIIGFIIYTIFNMVGLSMIGIIILILCAASGFVIGTCKMPAIDSFKLTRQTAGENIDDIIKRAIKFKLKKNRIYVYTKEEE